MRAVGLAGPVYGLGAALALGIYGLTHVRIWGAVANFGAVINLFNLIHVWQPDGSRSVHSLTRYQRGLVVCAAAAPWLTTTNLMPMLIAAACVIDVHQGLANGIRQPGLAMFAGLLAALSLVVVLSAGATATATGRQVCRLRAASVLPLLCCAVCRGPKCRRDRTLPPPTPRRPPRSDNSAAA
jgi:Zn-dependent protease